MLFHSSREFFYPQQHSFGDLPLRIGESGLASSRVQHSRDWPLLSRTPKVNGQQLLFGSSLSGNRRLWCRASHATQTPEPRNSDSTPPVLHLLWRPHSATSPPSLVRSGIVGSRLHRLQFPCITKPRTPILRCHLSTSPGEAYVSTPVSLSLYRDFAIREFAPPDAQGHRPCKTPNPDSSRSSTTCPPSDQRLRWTRGIAGRDFKEYRALTSGNAELRTPNQRDPTPRVPSPIDGSD
jgi:hypothetical protein